MTLRTKKAVVQRSWMCLSILLYNQISVEVRTGPVKGTISKILKIENLKNKPKQVNVIIVLPFFNPIVLGSTYEF